MRSARVALAALTLVLTGSVLALDATASCIQQSLTEQAGRADAVVYGRVTGLEGPPGGPPGRFALVEVQQVLKGSAPARIGVALGPGAEAGAGGPPVATSVDYTVQRGEDHTLYLKQHAPAGFATDACAGSHSGPPTPEETAFFGPGRAPEPVPGGIGGASGTDRLIAAVATVAALAAGVASIAFARRSERTRGAV